MWYKKKKIIIPLGIFVLLLIVRAVMVPVVHKKLNKFLASFSPTYYFHMADLDIHIIRGAYSFDGITGRVKGQKKDFLKIEKVDVSVAWRELLRGKVVTDIEVTAPDFSYTKAFKDATVASPKKKDQAKTAKDKLFPVKVERVDVKQGTLSLDAFRVTNIDGRISNLTADEKFPLSFYNLKATILGSSVVKLTGHLNTRKHPLEWDADGEIQGFDLTSANQFLKQKVPLTFTKGKMDVYAEAESKHGEIEGYVKPFLKNIDVIKKQEHFKGPKHWFIEVVSALGNLILRTSDTKSVATKIPFNIDKGGVHVDRGEALSKAIEHGFEQRLSPGVEDVYDLE